VRPLDSQKIIGGRNYIRKNLRKLICMAAATIMVLAAGTGVSAVEESFSIQGASNVTVSIPSEPVFTSGVNTGTISSGSDITFTGSNEDIYVTDETGTNSGWKFSIAITDFYSQGIDDPTDAGTEDMDVFVAAGDWLSFDIDNSVDGITDDSTHTLVPGTGGSGETVAADNVFFLGNPLPSASPNCSVITTDTVNIVTVSPGYGAGIYYFDLNYTITVDEWLPEGSKVDSTSTSGGRFDDLTIGSQDKVQVFEGTYTTSITYSASCNPAS
jgi:hypothetical protein